MTHDLNKVRKLLKTNTPVQLMEILGCCRSTAYKLAAESGATWPKRPNDPELRESWRRALADSRSLAEAGRRMGTSREAARRMKDRLDKSTRVTDQQNSK